MAVAYVQTSGNLQAPFGKSPIPGLVLMTPEGVGALALITLNVPAPVVSTNPSGSPISGWFGISVNGVALPNYAQFSFNPTLMGQTFPVYAPTTLVVAVPLALKPQKVEALWQALGGGGLALVSPASLSMVA